MEFHVHVIHVMSIYIPCCKYSYTWPFRHVQTRIFMMDYTLLHRMYHWHSCVLHQVLYDDTNVYFLLTPWVSRPSPASSSRLCLGAFCRFWVVSVHSAALRALEGGQKLTHHGPWWKMPNELGNVLRKYYGNVMIPLIITHSLCKNMQNMQQDQLVSGNVCKILKHWLWNHEFHSLAAG